VPNWMQPVSNRWMEREFSGMICPPTGKNSLLGSQLVDAIAQRQCGGAGGLGKVRPW
jgi:hypothetical protein